MVIVEPFQDFYPLGNLHLCSLRLCFQHYWKVLLITVILVAKGSVQYPLTSRSHAAHNLFHSQLLSCMHVRIYLGPTGCGHARVAY